MRIAITDDAVEILWTCHVPGCERGGTASLPLEAFEEAGEGASGLEGKLFSVVMKGLRSMAGRERHIDEVVELPPVPCEYHAAAVAVLGRADVGLEDGDRPRFYFEEAADGGRRGGEDASGAPDASEQTREEGGDGE